MAYAEHVDRYLDAGWRCVIPVPAADKTPPPDGYTGDHGADEIPADVLARWKATRARHSIAIRMPAGVIAIDVDHYDKVKIRADRPLTVVAKRGDDTLREYEGRWGVLPATWSSTARGSTAGPGRSRTLFFRVPAGRYATTLGPPTVGAVEILQRHHRYCVVAPSLHLEVGAHYCWYGPSGAPTVDVPRPEQLPELPAGWVVGLSEGATKPTAIAATAAAGVELLAELTADTRAECSDITNIRLTATDELESAGAGSRHDTATRRVYQLIRAGAFGHTGIGPALDALREAWNELTAAEGRAGEFDSMCLSAARKAVSEVLATGSAAPVRYDPCLMVQVVAPPSATQPAPDDTEADVLEVPPAAAPMVWSRRALIGVQAFDPPVLVDHKLAAACLDRVRPVVRYLTDINEWVVRCAHSWEIVTKDLADWIITELYDLMPDGDPDSESHEAKNRASRKKKFGMNSSSSGVASKMRAMLRTSGHPCTMAAADIDADPEILWAGGLPWSLRHCLHRPTIALLPPDTPHLHSAGVAPSGLGLAHPTPYWDAFTAAVWPDADIRLWALRVLSVCLTGYSDALMQVLRGETGLGKTRLNALIMSLLGTYATAADPRLLMSADAAHASIVYALKGVRLAFIDEGPREGKLATSRLKQLTGGGQLTGNPMRGNPVKFDPTHTLVLTCNPEETPTFQDKALRRRLRFLACEGNADAVAAARAALTHEVWKVEAPGVLAQLMHHAAEWLNNREVAAQWVAPESIRWRAEDIAAGEDPIKQWIAADMEPIEACVIPTTDLLAWFVEWYRRLNPKANAPTMTLFGRRLSDLGYPSDDHRVNGQVVKCRALRRRGNTTGPITPGPQRNPRPVPTTEQLEQITGIPSPSAPPDQQSSQKRAPHVPKTPANATPHVPNTSSETEITDMTTYPADADESTPVDAVFKDELPHSSEGGGNPLA